MRNVVVFLLVAAVGALGAWGYFQQDTIRQQQRAMTQLTAQLQTASKATALDLQEKCARQAHEIFKSSGWERQPLAGFGNHYNAAMNKCFMVIENTSQDTSNPGVITTNKILLDAFEGSTYGEYMWSSEKDKKYWEVKPFLCDVQLASGEKKACQSQDEFDEMLKNYMGEDFH
jgi:hypothetical protein